MADHSTAPAVAEAHVHDDHGHNGHEDLMLVGYDGELHPAHLQHHFVSAEQQFESSKLGMWLFLVTEIRLFGGMFVAYAIFRAWYPELYAEASLQLDTVMGAVNTLVLLASSLTVAWAIRGAQTDNQKVLFWNLIATVALAGTFMVVKYFEYTHKFDLGIYPGEHFVYDAGTITVSGEEVQVLTPAGLDSVNPNAQGAELVGDPDGALGAGEDLLEGGIGAEGETVGALDQGVIEEEIAEAGHEGDDHAAADDHAGEEAHDDHGREGAIFSNPRAGVFFSIYYVMTGIHGLHVLIGMIAISILAWQSRRGKYSSVYYTPVENVGLYWHVVDIIWIFLFPLMYLI